MKYRHRLGLSSIAIIGLLVGVLSVWLNACGYRFTGSGEFVVPVQRITVNVFDNRTSETGIETIFTNDLVFEFTRRGTVSVVPPEQAQARLSGTIDAMRIDTISHEGPTTAEEQRVTFWVSIQLRNLNGTLLWSAKGITENESYVVAEDAAATEQNRRQAIIQLSSRLAERIYSRMTDNF